MPTLEEVKSQVLKEMGHNSRFAINHFIIKAIELTYAKLTHQEPPATSPGTENQTETSSQQQ